MDEVAERAVKVQEFVDPLAIGDRPMTEGGEVLNVADGIFAIAAAGSQIADALHDVADAIRGLS